MGPPEQQVGQATQSQRQTTFITDPEAYYYTTETLNGLHETERFEDGTKRFGNGTKRFGNETFR